MSTLHICPHGMYSGSFTFIIFYKWTVNLCSVISFAAVDLCLQSMKNKGNGIYRHSEECMFHVRVYNFQSCDNFVSLLCPLYHIEKSTQLSDMSPVSILEWKGCDACILGKKKELFSIIWPLEVHCVPVLDVRWQIQKPSYPNFNLSLPEPCRSHFLLLFNLIFCVTCSSSHFLRHYDLGKFMFLEPHS
jgi:hypothetical protein